MPHYFARPALDQQETVLLLVSSRFAQQSRKSPVTLHGLQAEWLIAKLSTSEQQARSLEESEMACLLSEAQALCPELAGLQAADLDAGHGSAVCALLSGLTDKAVAAAPPPRPQRQAIRQASCREGFGLNTDTVAYVLTALCAAVGCCLPLQIPARWWEPRMMLQILQRTARAEATTLVQVSSDPGAALHGADAQAGPRGMLLLLLLALLTKAQHWCRLPAKPGQQRLPGCAERACSAFLSQQALAAGAARWPAWPLPSTGWTSIWRRLSPTWQPCASRWAAWHPVHGLSTQQVQGPSAGTCWGLIRQCVKSRPACHACRPAADAQLAWQVQADTSRLQRLEDSLNARLQPQLGRLQAQTLRLAALQEEQAQAQQVCASLARCTTCLAKVGHFCVVPRAATQMLPSSCDQLMALAVPAARPGMHAAVLQELQLKRRQVEMATAQAADAHHLARVQGAVQALNKDAERLALHLGLLQHQLRKCDAPLVAVL